PLQIPHRFSKKEDIEISAFLTATIAWGNRKSIINNATRLMELMDDSPYDFVSNHEPSDLDKLSGFVHRTFNGQDASYFMQSLQNLYENHGGLEGVFSKTGESNSLEPSGNEIPNKSVKSNSSNQSQTEKISAKTVNKNVPSKSLAKKSAKTAKRGTSSSKPDYEIDTLQPVISSFKKAFFELPHSIRTQKHVSDPLKGSAAKRINMFLRWMVRPEDKGVDFGLWKSIGTERLSCPLDVHSGNVARKLKLLRRKQNDAKALAELDKNLRKLDPIDPVKYDFALFGLGVFEKF
ncbi:MAG: TIGR02757 family protein, partial [Pricia sp.]